MSKITRSIYIDKEVWEHIKKEAANDKRAVGNFIEIMFEKMMKKLKRDKDN